MTSAEQYLLELINRARLDPVGEAWRYGIELNQGLQPGQLDDGARQALAPNALLSAAAAAHSRWMLEADHFSHTGAGGSTAGERMEAAGYVFSGAWSWGENLALSMSTASISLEDAIARHHEGLFLSPGHRVNLLGARFSELGIGQEAGRFTDGRTYNASMLTENFARSGSATFLTGVVYADDDDDGFYSMGEGAGGLTVRSAALQSAVASAGGYALGLSAAGRVEAAFVGEGMPEVRFAVDLSAGNAKVDLVDGAHLKSSANLTLLAGATTATLLGVADLELTGSAASERLVGNAGANYLSGGGGDDILVGGAGDDVLDGGEGFDVAEYAGYSADFVVTRTAEGYLVSSARFGTDTLLGIERLAFFDQTLPVAQAAHNTASIGHAVGAAVGGADGGQRDTALFLQQQFGLSLAEARGWVMERLEAPWEIYDVCASNTVTSAMLADVVRAGFPEVIITGVVVNEWLNAQGMPALA